MSVSLEIVIKPGKSRVYLRLIFIISLLSVVLIVNSSIYLIIKLLLVLLLFIRLKFDFTHQNPCHTIQQIKGGNKKWILLMDNGTTQHYDDAKILIHNSLFQLIELANSNRNKLLVLFNDQISNNQLRILHLKATKSSI